MASLRVLGLDGIDELARLLGRVRPGERRDKTGTLDLNFVGEERAGGERAKSGHAPSLRERARPQSVTRIAGA